mmetsp:Transcript_9178/g.13332  ORF Transcript_9178/g.13332 Transcript_9178/m.13332 type:complete len:235 (-) Transcript_9178:240-944(-)|eukprot:CAMPEP_0195508594 /NCGR_PEP_ID=MMETSP0794_2-20130614/1760_1 /TAXON_ID=515487 /ORGANISM="Stephanopyxis turris, Strain CCMP 815" /LENGTH=234 /DNA_ID=CAMNT_0040635593 /DNA_START=206 /DNA_END=910 /DNA_ORIENTATION=-
MSALLHLRCINDNTNTKGMFIAALTFATATISLTSFSLCGDIYGSGPAFMAVLHALALCGYVVYLIVSFRKRVQHPKVEFGLSLILIVACLQQAVVWGCLTAPVFEEKLMELVGDQSQSDQALCLTYCTDVNITTTFETAMASLRQLIEVEAIMCFANAILGILWIPYCLAQWTAGVKAPQIVARPLAAPIDEDNMFFDVRTLRAPDSDSGGYMLHHEDDDDSADNRSEGSFTE